MRRNFRAARLVDLPYAGRGCSSRNKCRRFLSLVHGFITFAPTKEPSVNRLCRYACLVAALFAAPAVGAAPETFNNQNRRRINWFGRAPDWQDVMGFRGADDIDSPGQEWTRLDVVADGSSITTYVNGVKVNEGYNVSPTAGRLQFADGTGRIFRALLGALSAPRRAEGCSCAPIAPARRRVGGLIIKVRHTAAMFRSAGASRRLGCCVL